MLDENFKKSVISSFYAAKEHILALESQIEALKQVLLKQNDVIKQLSEKIIEVSQNPPENPTKPFFYGSIGNKGVKQSINQSSNQSLKHTLSTKKPEISEFEGEFSPPEGDLGQDPYEIPENPEKIVQSREISQKKVDLPSPKPPVHTDILDDNFRVFKHNLNKAFNKLSRQELKAFLTIYQLDEQNGGVSYTELAEKMSLSETCIRAYISSLFKKGIPIIKTKINNKKTLVGIKKDFKILNLKQKILNYYYEKDPYQTRLFDVEK